MFEIYDCIDGALIDGNLTLEAAIDMLQYYHANRNRCTYGIRLRR